LTIWHCNLSTELVDCFFFGDFAHWVVGINHLTRESISFSFVLDQGDLLSYGTDGITR